MDECIKREAVLNLFSGEPLRIHYPDWYAEKIKALPAADAVPVVRCKDCAHLYGTICTVCGLLPRKPDDFCSLGERKDGADHEADQ